MTAQNPENTPPDAQSSFAERLRLQHLQNFEARDPGEALTDLQALDAVNRLGYTYDDVAEIRADATDQKSLYDAEGNSLSAEDQKKTLTELALDVSERRYPFDDAMTPEQVDEYQHRAESFADNAAHLSLLDSKDFTAYSIFTPDEVSGLIELSQAGFSKDLTPQMLASEATVDADDSLLDQFEKTKQYAGDEVDELERKGALSHDALIRRLGRRARNALRVEDYSKSLEPARDSDVQIVDDIRESRRVANNFAAPEHSAFVERYKAEVAAKAEKEKQAAATPKEKKLGKRAVAWASRRWAARDHGDAPSLLLSRDTLDNGIEKAREIKKEYKQKKEHVKYQDELAAKRNAERIRKQGGTWAEILLGKRAA